MQAFLPHMLLQQILTKTGHPHRHGHSWHLHCCPSSQSLALAFIQCILFDLVPTERYTEHQPNRDEKKKE